MIDMLLLDVLCTRKDYKAWCEVPLKTEAVAGMCGLCGGQDINANEASKAFCCCA